MIASIKHRFLAGLTDLLLVCVFVLYPLYNLAGSESESEVISRFILLLILYLAVYPLIIPLVNSFLISRLGGTVGKLLTGTTIVDKKEKKLSFWLAFMRNYIGYAVSGSLFFLGFLWIIWDRERRAWHDMIVDSKVIIVEKIGALTGVIAVVLLLAVNIVLVRATISEFEKHWPVYQNVVEDIIFELKVIERKSKTSERF